MRRSEKYYNQVTMKGKLAELRFVGKPQLKSPSFGEKFYGVFTNY